MEINVAIGGGQKMTLTGAILVYQGGHEAFAAWHAAKAAEDGAAPYLGEAEPLTTEFLRALSEGLGACCAGNSSIISPRSNLGTLDLVDSGAASSFVFQRAQRSW